LIKENEIVLPKGFILILAMLMSITPLAIDVYLPSFTQIAQFYYTSIDEIEVTLSIYLLGFAFGQLLGGPLSDRYGRKIFIFIGLIVYISFSFLLSQASSIEQLWAFRFFQAIGGGFAVVNTNAIIRDLYHGHEAAKVFSLMSIIMMIAPMIAPFIGASILYFFTWQYIFVFLGLYALLLVYFIFRLPETSPKDLGNFIQNYKSVLGDKTTALIMIGGGFATSGLFIFITKSSFIYMEYYHVSTNIFPILLGVNVITLMFFGKMNMTLLQKHSIQKLLFFGIFLQFISSVLLLITSGFDLIYLTVVFMMFYVGSLGLIFGNVITLVLENFKEISATANAINGVVGFIIAGIMGFIASLIHDGSLTSVFAFMSITTFSSFVILISIRKKILNLGEN
jgi:DHA1 family bicyclomycin/chloramphenicol resistance-like MFS transporter